MRDRGFPLSGGAAYAKPTITITLEDGAAFVADGATYPTWTAAQRFAIANQCDEFADAFFGRNGTPDPEELDRLLRTLYDLVHGI